MPKDYRLGVDIGGTFTDLVLLDEGTGRLFNEKVLTTPADPSQGVMEGIDRILSKTGVQPSQLRHVIHGTTLVANAIIERRGEPVALVTTRGFRDILEIGTEWRYDTYDLFMEMPEPLVERKWRHEVSERVGPDGSVVEPLDDDSVREVARGIRESGAASVAVSLLHSFRNAEHEHRVRDILVSELPDSVVCISSDVMPEIGEYERTSTAICNAYVLPVFQRYLRRLTDGLRSMGFERDLYLMLSDGGSVHESTAAIYPIRLVQSGPAGGVQATSAMGRLAGEDNLLCFDMGGTTAKACLIDDGDPALTTEFEVARVYRFKRGSGIPLRVPVIDMIEIGAGGGSIASVNHLGLVQVGPTSASAVPGPACYGRGGLEPTVTDADLVLGYLAPDNFLGGDMQLDIAAAKASLKNRIADPLGIGAVDAAWAIHETVNESMSQAAIIHALEKAKSISNYAMVPIGGAGPVHACNIGLKLGVSKVISPPSAGVASALGFLVAPTAFTFVHGGVVGLDKLDFPEVQGLLSEMESRGRELLSKAGVDEADVRVGQQAAMRYVGQGYDVKADIPGHFLANQDSEGMRRTFETEYARQYGRSEPHMAVEVVSWQVIVSGPKPVIDLVAARPQSQEGEALKGERDVYFGPEGGFVTTPVYERSRCLPGFYAEGPGIFEERESTTIVPPGARIRIDDALNLVIDLPQSSA